MDIPSDVSWQLGGTFEDQQDTFTDLGILMVLIIILVFIVMAAQFESLVDPFVIMFSIPFAFTGIVLGLAVTQTPLGVMALIGVIMLMGIVVKKRYRADRLYDLMSGTWHGYYHIGSDCRKNPVFARY